MAFVFLATQGVSSRHNEAVSDRHRSRLTNRKNNKSTTKSCVNYYYPEGEPSIELNSLDVNEKPQHSVDTKDEGELCPSFYISDDDLIEEEFCNNNNDNIYNLNNKLSKSGSPVDAFPPSLIKWPLDNNSKSKRLADIRKQVKRLSSVIKMTIDNDDHVGAKGAEVRANPLPFSSHADMTLLPCAPVAGEGTLHSFDALSSLLKVHKMKEVKVMIRESTWAMNDPIREHLWKGLIQHLTTEEFTDQYYWDTVQQIYGSTELSNCHAALPSFVDQKHLVSHGLSADGIKACNRVISVLAYSFPAIVYAPLVYPVTAILMHYMNECDAYNCISVLVSNSSAFISQTKVSHESMWRAVEIFAKKHVSGSFSMLHKYGITSQQIDEGFQNWVWWLFAYLPVTHLVRVLDCFLLEGSKVLIRCSLAIFHLFMKHAARDSNIATTLTTKGITEAIALYCQNINVTPSKLLKTAFGIRAFSKTEIKKVVTENEMLVKNERSVGSSGGHQEVHFDGLPSAESQENMQLKSHTFNIKEGSQSPMPRVRAAEPYPIHHIKSSVVIPDELLTLWGWLPTRMTMQHPTLVYTTEEHGSSLTNFFLRAGPCEPTILLVRTTTDCVFGAYCSAAWNQRNQRDEYGNKQTYFGTGETFLFTLRPKPVKYEWVGITQQRENATLSSVAHQAELFMHADNDMVTVGGGHGHGLMLDHDLQFGKTETCETFNNPPLCPESDFEIKVVEVYSLSES